MIQKYDKYSVFWREKIIENNFSNYDRNLVDWYMLKVNPFINPISLTMPVSSKIKIRELLQNGQKTV